uniref:Calcitonin gene-related peptide type 1 receptor n=1 Tax=Oreochromis niloticus TaxID=8128 RepID=I3JRS7_ORENI
RTDVSQLHCSCSSFPFRDMWKTLTLSLLVALALFTVSLAVTEKTMPRQENFTDMDLANLLGQSRRQILAAQFECYLKIIHDPVTKEDPYCNRTWDGWLCWDDSAPGTVMQMCPAYFMDFDPSERVTKVCNPDGQWFHHPESKRIWSNYTMCSAHTNHKLKLAFSVYYMAMVGHSLSIVSLVISLTIFSYFKSLSCQRISLHKNMFLSFILNSIVTMIWLTFSVVNSQGTDTSNSVNCKILAVLTQYTSTSTYFWMLCEGIYLHTLIIVAVFVGEQQLFWYYILGWGESGGSNTFMCWISTHTLLLYIVHAPIQVALIVNFFFLLNIVRVLITKLKETHCAESTTYMKAVRATLILIPLLGIQYILIPWAPEGRISRAVYEFFLNIFTHFQGLLVASIFCFCNNEAQTAVRRKWFQCKSAWGKTGWGETPLTNSPFNYHTNSSITETSRITMNSETPANAPSEKKDSISVVPENASRKKSNACTNGEIGNILETTQI